MTDMKRAYNTHIVQKTKELLQSGCSGVLGLKRRWGQVGPYLFTRDDALDDLIIEPRYPMAKVARTLLEAKPGTRIGVVARGCDVRALQALAQGHLIDAQSVAFVGVECSEEQAAECNCEKPVYTLTKCTGCWECVKKCPEEAIKINSCCPIVLPNEFDEDLASRRAVYIPYPQAVPRLALRDKEHCLKLTGKLDCKGCTNICEAKAITAEDSDREEVIEVGAVLLATGFDEFDARRKYELGYSRFTDVVTSIEFERILSASGPCAGHVLRPSDGKTPKRIAFLQCVGSRDQQCGNTYCSSVCCMYAIKEAVIAKEHDRSVEPTIFYMDMRAFGKDFDKYYERARDEYGVRFVRSRVAKVDRRPGWHVGCGLCDRRRAARCTRQFDMVVLSVGLEPSKGTKALIEKLGLRKGEGGFVYTDEFHPLSSFARGHVCLRRSQRPQGYPRDGDAGQRRRRRGRRAAGSRSAIP